MAQKQFIIDGGFTTNADSSLTGNLDMTGHIIPTVDSDGVTGYDLGSPDMKWRDLYLSQGSLYIDGQKVIESNSGTIVVQADPGQSLTTKVSGAGVMTLESDTTVTVAATLQMASGKRITDQGGDAVVFGDKVNLDNNQIINVGSPTADGHATTKLYVDQLVGAISTDAITEGDTEIEIADLGTGTVGITVDGAQRLALSGTAAAFTVPVTVNGIELADLNELSTAQSAASSYTDARETAITTAYTAYSDVQKSRIDAIMSASTTDADTFAEVVSLVNSVDATNDSVLAGEIANRTSADSALSGRLDTVEGTGAGSVVKAQADAIASAEAKDVVRAAAAEADATTKANLAEADAIAAAEAKDVVRAAAANAYADQAEVDAKAYTDTRETAITTAYEAADSTLQTNINTEKSRIDAILSASSADKDTFAEIVTFVNSVDTTNDTALGTEITTRADADTALSGRLDTVEGSGAGSVAKAQADAIATAAADATTKADAAEAAAIAASASALTSFHSAIQDITSSATVAYTFSELVGAKFYQVFLNRQLIRPSELDSVNLSTGVVTFEANVVASGDEIEVNGFKA